MVSHLLAAASCFSLAHLCFGMAVHPVVFPARQPTSADGPSNSNPSSSSSTSNEIIIFLHGRLEADDDENLDIPAPSELYSDFLSELSNKLPADSSKILMPAYHEVYKDLKREPRHLSSLGPITSAIGEVIRGHIEEEVLHRSDQEPIHLTLISFSMGAAVLMKLLASDPILSSKNRRIGNHPMTIRRLIFIEPVWRCWLPFAVSEAAVAVRDANKSVEISEVPTLAIAGTNDSESRHDSGCNGNSMDGVGRSLRPFLPNICVVEIEGGNHFGICSGVDDIAMDSLGEGMTLPVHRAAIIEMICEFCDW